MPILKLPDEERGKILEDAIMMDALAFFRLLDIDPATDRAQRQILAWQANPITMPFRGIGGNIIFTDTRENRENLLSFLVMTEIERRDRNHAKADRDYLEADAEFGSLKREIDELSKVHGCETVVLQKRQRRVELVGIKSRCNERRLSPTQARTLETVILDDKLHIQMGVCASKPYSYPTNLPTDYDMAILDRIFDTANQGLERALTSAKDATHDVVGVDRLRLVVQESTGEAMKSADNIKALIAAIEDAPRVAAEKEQLRQAKEKTRQLEEIAGEAQDFAREFRTGNTADELLQIKLQGESFYGIILDLAACLVQSDPKYGSKVKENYDEISRRIRKAILAVAKNRGVTCFPPECNLLASVIMVSPQGKEGFRNFYLSEGVVRVEGSYSIFIAEKLSPKNIYPQMRSYCEQRLGINPDNISEEHQALLAMGFAIHPSEPISPDLLEVARCSIRDPLFSLVLRFFIEHGGCSVRRSKYSQDKKGERLYVQACAQALMKEGYDAVRERMQQAKQTHLDDAPLYKEIQQLGGEKTEFFQKELYAHPAFTLFGNMAIGFHLASSPEEALTLFADRFIPIHDRLVDVTQSLGAILYGLMPRILQWKGDVRIFFGELCEQVGDSDEFMRMELVEIMMLAIKHLKNGSGQEDEDEELEIGGF